MHHSSVAVTTLAAAAFLAGCGATPRPATPAPEAAAAGAAAPVTAAPAAQPGAQQTLAGEWEVRISSAQQGVIASMMRLVERGNGYVGMLQPLLNSRGESAIPGAGPGPVQVRSATLEGDRVTIVLDLEGDEGRIVASFRGPNQLDGAISSRRLSGRITLLRH